MCQMFPHKKDTLCSYKTYMNGTKSDDLLRKSDDSKEKVNILKAPCYLCGEPAVVEGLCEGCYNKEHPLIEVDTPLSIRVCKRCGAVEIPGGWKTIKTSTFNSEEAIEQQLDILLDMEIRPFFSNLGLTVVEEKKLDRVLHISLIVNGKSHPSLPDHDEEYPVEIRFRYITCTTCQLMSGGYYEATLQIRADGRSVKDEEGDLIAEIAKERTHSEYGKDPKAFILEVNKTKFGFDYFIGSELLCRKIVEDIESEFLAEKKVNYKLIGEDKGGRKKYRTTTLLRLPKFSNGDFISISNKPSVILSMGRGGVSCYNLVNRERFTITPKSSKWKILEFLESGSSKREFMVTSRAYGQPVQLMDSESFDMVELDEGNFGPAIVNGSKVFLFQYNDRYYLLP